MGYPYEVQSPVERTTGSRVKFGILVASEGLMAATEARSHIAENGVDPAKLRQGTMVSAACNHS